MPDRNVYGEPLPHAEAVVIHPRDRGPDPRHAVALTLRVVSMWHECDYTLIADEVEDMKPDDPECALCGYEECQTGCPMARWRGQE